MFQDLIARKLVQKKTYENGLSVYKYTRKVFYDALWNEDARLLDARGMVLDAEGNKVIWPFTKIFNRGENGTDVDRDQMVVCADKMNGFMASVRQYSGELLVSTTGTLDSEYATMARETILKQYEGSASGWIALSRWTLLFEIVHEDDPHIVHEEPGAYLIGMREMSTGVMEQEHFLDWIAARFGFSRSTWSVKRFGDVVEDMKTSEREGCVVRHVTSGELLLKIKTPHYLTKKFLMRMGKGKVENMFDDTKTFLRTIDEEFYGIVEYITQGFSKEVWLSFTDQQRRSRIEDYFNEGE
ncbi:RNA ligase [compost metagenome]